jgi:uncharacterized membrane protein
MKQAFAVLGILLAACSVRGDSDGGGPNAVQGTRDGKWEVVEQPPPGELPARTSQNAPQEQAVSACLSQDGEKLRITPVKVIGNEPFWSAQVEGRCVTYSTPEDQKGTRIWTRFNPGPDGGAWVGSLDGKLFKLVTRLRQGCSDGMSDRSYPLDAMLTVRGEERRGCAASD